MLVSQTREGIQISQSSLTHHVYGHAGKTGNECAEAAACLGMRGFVSENNVPIFWLERGLFVQRLLEVRHCLTQVAERSHTLLVYLDWNSGSHMCQLHFSASCSAALGRRLGMGFRQAPTPF